MLAEILYGMMVVHTPPGYSRFSVAVAEDCAAQPEVACEGGIWSTFYGTWVRKETREQGQERYKVIAASLVHTAERLLCRTEDGHKIKDCKPAPGAVVNKVPWDVLTLSVGGLAVATIESGFREDVQVGRGWSKKASDDGGMGRGGGQEGCFVQAHPVAAWEYVDDADPELVARAKVGDGAAREQIVRSLLGSDEAALGRCWTVGLKMLMHARAHCAWDSPETPWDWSTVALFGTGNSCTSPNQGKTAVRTELFRRLLNEARAKRRAARALPSPRPNAENS
jgi:hypothetical protein